MYNRKLAFALAKQYRTCPPAYIRDDPVQKPMLDRHIAVCPYCAAHTTSPHLPWEDLVQGIKRILVPVSGDLSRETPAPGQLRPVRIDLGRWRDREYYNPPLVLIVGALPGPFHAVHVAQTYHDLSLAGPGDLVIAEQESDFAEIFIESWNTYTLKAEDLGSALGQVKMDIVRAVRMLEQDPSAYPSWAMRPAPFEDHDVRIYFRELEVETGFTFGSLAVGEIVDEIEDRFPRLVYASIGEAQESIRQNMPGVHWRFEPKSIHEALALVRFPPDTLALAAADQAGNLLPAKIIMIVKGKISSTIPITVVILLDQVVSGVREMSGRALGIPDNLSGAVVIAFLEIKGKSPIPSHECHWDEKTGAFFAAFEGEGASEGNLALAVVYGDIEASDD